MRFIVFGDSKGKEDGIKNKVARKLNFPATFISLISNQFS